MKKILFGCLAFISLNIFAQDRIAIPSIKKDTLYIIDDESGEMIIELWRRDRDRKNHTMPTFIKLTPEEFNRKLYYYSYNNREKQQPLR